jgi:hypothetical protein
LGAELQFEHGLVGDAIDFAIAGQMLSGSFATGSIRAEEMNITLQTLRMVQQMAYGNFRAPSGNRREKGWQTIFVSKLNALAMWAHETILNE